VTWLWLVALGSAVWTIGRGEAWGSARPGLLPASGAWIPVLLLGIPALVALAVAAVARFGGSGPVRVAISGIAGPALLAVAYVIGAPGGGTQTSSYQYALLGVAVAAAVSVLVAVARKPPPGMLRRPERAKEPVRGNGAPARRDEPWTGAHRHPAWTDAPDEETWPGDDSPTDPVPARSHTWTDEPTDPVPARGGADRDADAGAADDPTTPGESGKPAPAQGRARVEGSVGPATARPDADDWPDEAARGRTGAGEAANQGGWPDETPRDRAGDEETVPRPSGGRRRKPDDETTDALPAGGWRDGDDATTDPIPAARGGDDATTESVPAAEPPAKRGRRGRRRGQDAGDQPVPSRDSDYVDWVRALGRSGGGSGGSGKE
jgi:hypothetical protein